MGEQAGRFRRQDRASSSASGPGPTRLWLRPCVNSAAVERELARLVAELEHSPGHMVLCDATQVVSAGLADIDLVARLCLIVSRRGGQFALTGASPTLQDLAALAGLTDLLATSDVTR